MRLDYFLPRSVTRAVFGLMGLEQPALLSAPSSCLMKFSPTNSLGDGARIQSPKMVYDPHMQMMVEPGSRLPIYSNGKNIKPQPRRLRPAVATVQRMTDARTAKAADRNHTHYDFGNRAIGQRSGISPSEGYSVVWR